MKLKENDVVWLPSDDNIGIVYGFVGFGKPDLHICTEYTAPEPGFGDVFRVCTIPQQHSQFKQAIKIGEL